MKLKSLHADAMPRCEPSVAAERLAWALARCQEIRLRMTVARERILRYLADHPGPMSWEMLAGAETLRGRCDPATIYRTLILLKESDIVRQLSLPHKVTYFALNVPSDNSAHLICRRCGNIFALSLPKSVMRDIQLVAAVNGFSWPNHELDFYGLCHECQTARQKEILPSKLRVRN
jgi:Fe2+ or Zn2+ uptake regulation protein